MNYRPLRVANLIRDELTKLILREVEFDGALVTVTDISIDKKLEAARVRVSVLPSPKAAAALKTLQAKTGELQHLLSRKLNIKPMPRIRFELDPGPEKAANVEKILLDE